MQKPLPTIVRYLGIGAFLGGLGCSGLAAAVAETELSVCTPDTPWRLDLRVEPLAGPKGNIRAQIYGDNPDEWLEKGKKLIRTEVPAEAEKGGTQALCVPLPGPGTYALVVMHDKNKNGKADIFSEGFGFSNNPKLGLSKPDHEDVAITITEPVTELDIRLRYVFGTPKKKSARRRRTR